MKQTESQRLAERLDPDLPTILRIDAEHAGALLRRQDELLVQALEALEESVDLVRHDYECNWRHGVPSREQQLAGLKAQLDQHETTVDAIRAHLEAK